MEKAPVTEANDNTATSQSPRETPEPPRPSAAKRWMKRLALLCVLLGLAVAGTLAVGYHWLGRWMQTPFGSEREAALTIAPGTSTRGIVAQLVDAGKLERAEPMLAWLRLERLRGRAPNLQAGEYRLSGSLTPAELVARLGHGRFERSLTIPEGFTTHQIAQRLKEEGWIDDESHWLTLTAAPQTLQSPMLELPEGTDGFCYPDTYRLEKDTPPERILETMLTHFGEIWLGLTPDERSEDAQTLSIHEIVTLASIIQREARLEEEMPRIASVFYNRMRRGMRLQSCATVHYALGEVWNRSLTYDDLELEHPYNTYKIKGLPPGPIANPGRAALEAALRPAEGKDLYFVYAGDGHHIFSRTHREHQRAIRKINAK